jgi:RND family efflux transporter MFP subunit
MVLRRAFGDLSFLLPVCAGVAIAVLGLVVQEAVVDRPGAAATQGPGAPAPVSDAPGAREVVAADLLGVVVAPDLVEVAARTEGRVTMIAAQLGDRVEPGAVLARIDDRNLRDQQAAARAAMHALVADRDKAESELEESRERKARSERLSQVLSEEELARVRYEEKYAASRLQATRARVDEQQTRVAILERSIDEAQLRAPFAGSIAARYVGVGATVSPGTPIVRLVSAGAVLVRFAIPEALGAPVRVGMAVTVDVEAASLSGMVDKLAPEVDAASRMIVAEAHVRVPAALSDLALVGRVARVRVTTPPGGEEPAP